MDSGLFLSTGVTDVRQQATKRATPRRTIRRARAATFAFLIGFSFAAAIRCGDDPQPDDAIPQAAAVDPTPYIGRWQLTPSAQGASLVLFRDGAVTYRDELGEQTGRFQIDSQMLRIYLTSPSQPTGVFILSAHHRRGWRGLWNGDVRFLTK